MTLRGELPDNTLSTESVSLQNAQIYQSPAMFERRRRILREARGMISELGYDNFNFRELARRADVAPRTLYNAFGSRENIVASAILWYSKAFTDHAHHLEPAHTLRGQLERLIKVHSRNIQIRSYSIAIMTVYNSQNAAPPIRQAIRTLCYETVSPFVDHLAAGLYFDDYVKPKSYTAYLTSAVYCTLSDWCAGEILDNDLVDAMAQTLLVATLAFTRGAAKKEAQDWLIRVRAFSPEWEQLRTASATPEAPQRALPQVAKARKAPVAPPKERVKLGADQSRSSTQKMLSPSTAPGRRADDVST